jgi:hypothetical protein
VGDRRRRSSNPRHRDNIVKCLIASTGPFASGSCRFREADAGSLISEPWETLASSPAVANSLVPPGSWVDLRGERAGLRPRVPVAVDVLLGEGARLCVPEAVAERPVARKRPSHPVVTGERQALEDKQIYAARYPNMITRLSQTIGFQYGDFTCRGIECCHCRL